MVRTVVCVCVQQPVTSDGVLLATKLGFMFSPCMKPPPADLHKLQVLAVHRSPLCRQTVRAGELFSLSLAAVAHLQTRLTRLLAWGHIPARLHPNLLCQLKGSHRWKHIKAGVDTLVKRAHELFKKVLWYSMQ